MKTFILTALCTVLFVILALAVMPIVATILIWLCALMIGLGIPLAIACAVYGQIKRK